VFEMKSDFDAVPDELLVVIFSKIRCSIAATSWPSM